jgi:ATP-dependent helicase/nuclease subunit A
MSEPTPNQCRAMEARGNVLVEAGAGAGKTRTLVERCFARVFDGDDPVSLEELLMVTFTEAAAAEMRQRIRIELEARLNKDPDNRRLAEQSALLETAHISTLHSFCLHLAREHFYELEIDPQISVLDETESHLLAQETLEKMLCRHYAGSSQNAEAVQQLILAQSQGWDRPIRDLVLRLHEYTQTLSEPEEWFRQQFAEFQSATPNRWLPWLLQHITSWRKDWTEVLAGIPSENLHVQQCLGALCRLPEPASRADAAAMLRDLLAADVNWPDGQRLIRRRPLKDLFEQAGFLNSLVTTTDEVDPLTEDWNWIRQQMLALLELTQEFSAQFACAKRAEGAVDFHDLEQFALRLLWDDKARCPTAIAQEWRQKFRLIFVDEYQDINEAQNRIIEAVSRDGHESNRFLVGDMKQSIYRFRLADPRIFRTCSRQWARGIPLHQTIPLSENFRSHETILNFINPLFEILMHEEIGGVKYDEAARLRFGNPKERAALSAGTDPSPRVEVQLFLTGKESENGSDDSETNSDGLNLANLSSTDKEARLVALRLKEFKEQGLLIWDKASNSRRPVEWSDMVVLLRAPRGKTESFAKEFSRLDIPLEVARTGFFDALEVSDLLSVLTLLDNPLQDAPALAVLRSPLVGLSMDELARIRLAARKVRFWTALRRFHERHQSDPCWPTVDMFLQQFRRWRSLSRQASLAQRLQAVLDETHYLDWLLAQSRGRQRKANVLQLLALARRFDERQGRSLYRFLQFIDAQRDIAVNMEPVPVESADAVRLMSGHQSKGLEFPVVVAADLGKQFNLSELKGRIILDQEFGLCPQVKPPHTGQSYPSLPYWLARQRQKAEALGEELRILYVAFTRAQDRLILTGTCSAKTALEKWSQNAEVLPTRHELLKANNYLDWLGPFLTRMAPGWTTRSHGETSLWQWRIHRDADLTETARAKSERSVAVASRLDSGGLELLRRRLEWRYAFMPSLSQPAKTSVTSLRRHLTADVDGEAQPAPFLADYRRPVAKTNESELNAVDIGIAHHRFLQLAAMEALGDETALKGEVKRLTENHFLSEEEAEALDLRALSGLWQSEFGRRICANAAYVHRELPFTLRFTREDLAPLGLPMSDEIPAEEFVVVQGVVDLAVILPKEIWVLDFKTDKVDARSLTEKTAQYERQLKLYGLALSRIYQRPVTEHWLHLLAIGKTISV